MQHNTHKHILEKFQEKIRINGYKIAIKESA